MIKIILVEDHNIVRNGIRNLLEKIPEFQITGEAVNGFEVINLLESGASADIILADVNMPVMGGFELNERIQQLNPRMKVVLLTMLDHEKYLIKAFKSGVAGYLLKNIGADELVFAIKHVYHDGSYICSELALKLLSHIANSPESFENETQHDVEFTKRELEVLILTAEGFTNQEIADKLYTSKRTVEGHRQSMITKTGARNTVALVSYALRNRLIN